MDNRPVTLSQLDRAVERLRAVSPSAVPRGGWIRAIREAIGMTSEQLAMRLHITRQAVNDAERREAAEDITLAQLRRFAVALESELVYVLVPRTPLAEVVERRAETLARSEVAAVSHTMALEAQGTDAALVPERVEQVKRHFLSQRWSRLWD
jgi:predicted DNA-binding mobile mystery protein A